MGNRRMARKRDLYMFFFADGVGNLTCVGNVKVERELGAHWLVVVVEHNRVYLILMENEFHFHERDFGIFRSRVETLLANERQAHAVCLHHDVLSLSVSRPLACANGEKTASTPRKRLKMAHILELSQVANEKNIYEHRRKARGESPRAGTLLQRFFGKKGVELLKCSGGGCEVCLETSLSRRASTSYGNL